MKSNLKIYITNFYHVRFMKDNIIPVSTASTWPYWIYKSAKKPLGSYFLDKNNVMNGISEESLHFPKEQFEILHEQCSENCPYKDKVPNCEFMSAYYKYLTSLDFNKVITEFERLAKEVKAANNYKDDPVICLLVYESEKCNCAERPVLQRWFKENGYLLEEWLPNKI